MNEETYIRECVEAKATEIGCFVVDVKLTPVKIIVLLDKNEGITIQDCKHVSRHLEEALADSGMLEKYGLEVSSPGLDQPFKVMQQYRKNTGRKLRILTTGNKEVIGKLLAVSDEGLDIEEQLPKGEKKKSVINHYDFNQIKETRVVVLFNH